METIIRTRADLWKQATLEFTSDMIFFFFWMLKYNTSDADGRESGWAGLEGHKEEG